MADKKISQLTALSAANLAPSTDVLAIVDTSATETKKIVAQDLVNGVLNVASAVGIGTASPVSKLHVVQTAASEGLRIDGDGGGYAFVVNGGTDRTSRIRALSIGAAYVSTTPPTNGLIVDGDVGIGTASPAVKLHVAGQSRVADSSNAANYMTFGVGANAPYGNASISTTTAGLSIVAEGAGAMTFLNNGSERMRIDSSGNLGLGVTPSAWDAGFQVLENSGGSYSSGSNGAIRLLQNAYYGSSAYRYKFSSILASRYEMNSGAHQWYTAASGTAGNAISFTQAMTLDASGNLLVGTTSTAFTGRVVTLQTTSASNVITAWNSATSGDNSLIGFFTDGGTGRGSITYNRVGGLVAYNTTSDYRAKDILGPVQNSGATIDALKVYEGQMKGATQSRPMLVAHETQEHAPYAVTGEKDAVNDDGDPIYQQMDTSSLVPLLIAEIQSLRSRVAALEAK